MPGWTTWLLEWCVLPRASVRLAMSLWVVGSALAALGQLAQRGPKCVPAAEQARVRVLAGGLDAEHAPRVDGLAECRDVARSVAQHETINLAHVTLYYFYHFFFDRAADARQTLAGCPAIAAICAKVAAHPRVQAWEQARVNEAQKRSTKEEMAKWRRGTQCKGTRS